MRRREFLTRSCSACILLLGGSSLASLFLSCNQAQVLHAENRDGVVTIPLSTFAKADVVVVQPENAFYDIALFKKPDNQYGALLLSCTHAANPLQYNGTSFTCSLHGSVFDKDGTVMHGPARKRLKALNVKLNNNSISVYL